MSITTSYFAVSKVVIGKKISIARFNPKRIRVSIEEIIESFAPSEEILRQYQKGKINWSQYKTKYNSEQRRHYQKAPQDFWNLIRRADKENLVLLCYEKYDGPQTRCHRILLFNILKRVAKKRDYNIKFIEERCI